MDRIIYMTKTTQTFVYQAPNHIYPSYPPFHPYECYPEYEFKDIASEENIVYEAVRGCLQLANLDIEHYGTLRWNPFKNLIFPGETVLLKPNLVKERHPRDPNGWQYVLTHGSVIRAVADYVWKALEGRGKIIVADAPQTDSSFAQIVKLLGLDAIRDFYLQKGLDFELIDLRREEWVNQEGVIVDRRQLAGDPNGNIAYDLGTHSEFAGHKGEGRYYGADYDVDEVNRHHSGGKHEYLISGTAIKCDVFFNLPKLKTHKKVGITVNLKNLVGINGDKNWLPHHTEGDPAQHGDEHPEPDFLHRIERHIVPIFRTASRNFPGLGAWLHRKARKTGGAIFGDTEEVIRSGNWWGNDTTWRMCLDLNKILLYGNTDSTLRADHPQNRKRYFSLVDGIIAGEGKGPMNPDPVNAGVLLFGFNPATVDAACAYLMGFDPEKIPLVQGAFRSNHYAIAEWDWRDVQVISNHPEWNGLLPTIATESTFHFTPHFGWIGHIERLIEQRSIG